MKAWPSNDEIRSSGWSGSEQQFEPPADDGQELANMETGND